MKLHKYNEAKTMFYDYFHIGIGEFHESILSIAFERIVIDIYKIDEWLHKIYGDYESKNLSMKDVVTNQYGVEAFNFLSTIS